MPMLDNVNWVFKGDSLKLKAILLTQTSAGHRWRYGCLPFSSLQEDTVLIKMHWSLLDTVTIPVSVNVSNEKQWGWENSSRSSTQAVHQVVSQGGVTLLGSFQCLVWALALTEILSQTDSPSAGWQKLVYENKIPKSYFAMKTTPLLKMAIFSSDNQYILSLESRPTHCNQKFSWWATVN